eukprot:gene17191-21019_t
MCPGRRGLLGQPSVSPRSVCRVDRSLVTPAEPLDRRGAAQQAVKHHMGHVHALHLNLASQTLHKTPQRKLGRGKGRETGRAPSRCGG